MLDSLFAELKKAQAKLALVNRSQKDGALRSVMKALEADRASILGANALDVERARSSGMKEALIDRLLLNDKRITEIIQGVDVVVRQETRWVGWKRGGPCPTVSLSKGLPCPWEPRRLFTNPGPT